MKSGKYAWSEKIIIRLIMDSKSVLSDLYFDDGSVNLLLLHFNLMNIKTAQDSAFYGYAGSCL
ncbi:MAG: hypothetical protein ABFS03_04710 [Chloroflexota bacterium]